MRKLRALGFWLLLAALLALAVRLERGGAFREEIRAASGEKVHVIDGDSLRIGGREIRIAGIDAPEYRQTCLDRAGQPWPCGKEARTALEDLAQSGGLSCTKAAEDRYGRALAHCRTGTGDVGVQMARMGWALGARDQRFDLPEDAIAEARASRRGVWRGRHEHPADWRKRTAPKS